MRDLLFVVRRKASQLRIAWHAGRAEYHRQNAAYWRAQVAARIATGIRLDVPPAVDVTAAVERAAAAWLPGGLR